MKHAGRQSGFTLIELMVTLTVAAILVTWALPQMTNLMVSNRLTAVTNGMVASIQYARSEAIKRGKMVGITRLASGSCTSNCDWSGGWVVFFDNDIPANGRDADKSEDLRITDQANAGFKSLTFQTNQTEIDFLGNGALNQTTPVTFNISTTDLTAGEAYRAICLSYAGMVTSMHGTSTLTCP